MIKITYTPEFSKEFKRLSKKFPSLKADMQEVVLELGTNPVLGKSLGSNVFKIRLGIKSKGKGNSGGARIITYWISAEDKIYLPYIYDKSEQQSITIKEIRSLIRSIIN